MKCISHGRKSVVHFGWQASIVAAMNVEAMFFVAKCREAAIGSAPGGAMTSSASRA